MPDPSPQGDPRRPGTRVLVVDDCPDTARMMRVLLRARGFEVRLATGGPEAIEVASEFRPEFVLVDIGLPGMDGHEVAARLRREECCRDAIFIAISGFGGEEDRRRSKEAGMNHHLVKPVNPDALLALLSPAEDGP